MPQFYIPDLNIHTDSLAEEESRHAVKSLRLREGDEIVLLNGKGTTAVARIIQTGKNDVKLKVSGLKQAEEPKKKLSIAISPLNQSDRFEWFLEKAAELAVWEIFPVVCRRTERYKFRRERLEKILISGIKQSGNPFLPRLHDPVQYSDFINDFQAGNLFLCHCETGVKTPLHQIEFEGSAVFVIGPEGDFTNDEIEIAHGKGARFADLGTLTLRTETAGVAVSSYFHMLNS